MSEREPEKEKPAPGIKEIPVNPELPGINPLPKEAPIRKPEEPVKLPPEISPEKEKPNNSYH